VPVAEGARTVVRAAGGVVWRPRQGGPGVEVALVHRPKYDDWSLPKGKLDPGETAVAGACREVREETGFSCVVGRTLGESRYDVVQKGRPAAKSVRWWAMRALEGAFTPTAEIDELRWVSPQDAPGLLTRVRDGDPLRFFTAGPPQTRTVLLLRHGTAGDRAAWSGDDDARPLDDRGRAQAEAACAVLPLYGTARLVSAPLERCTATLQPLAERAGLEIETDVAVAARGWADDPGRTLQHVADLVADDRPTAVCSQGEVLPDLVRALAGRDGLPLSDVRAAKGSLWALSWDDDGRLADAHYTAALLG
jgi:8-oxo-(d)GTP phosphatase